MNGIVDRIRRTPWYRGQIAHVARVPAEGARPATIALHPRLRAYLDARGITLYHHQGEAISALREGKDVIITTPTASGKTLAFNIPILERMIADEDTCALYIYPLKALANDQLGKLRALERGCGLELHPATYDGDTPTGSRGRIKAHARIVLTNPHALHHYLPWHHQWARFFRNLQFIVIDEAHTYRGVFGANVALLLRRLYRILEHYGAHPQVILSSASIANPTEYARLLTGRDAVAITESAAGRGERTIVFWDGLVDPDVPLYLQAARLLATITSQGIQTICFTRSRAQAELVARRTGELGADGILPYRAGYLPRERREIEAGLRDGRIRGVVSTTALEAGIDIGGLDAAILLGYPGSVLSFWQQAGRAGRGEDPSLVVFIPYEDPLDRYLLRHPDHLLGQDRERIVLRPDNPRLVAGHIACAAAELPVQDGAEISRVGPEIVPALADRGLLAPTPRGYIYRGRTRAHALFPLDALAGAQVKLVCDGELLETMDPLRARRDAYPGAVLLHRGETYVVESLDLEEGVARARREAVDYYTKPLITSRVEILSPGERRAGFAVRSGRVQVREEFVGYQAIHSGRTIGVTPLELPPHTYETDGMWITFPEEIPGVPRPDLLGGLHGAEHALIALAPLTVLCDRDDLGGASMAFHPETGAPTIVLYDEVEGGAGLAEAVYARIGKVATEALSLVSGCPCENGCPSCIYSPRCGNRNRPLDKQATIAVLEFIVARSRG